MEPSLPVLSGRICSILLPSRISFFPVIDVRCQGHDGGGPRRRCAIDLCSELLLGAPSKRRSASSKASVLSFRPNAPKKAVFQERTNASITCEAAALAACCSNTSGRLILLRVKAPLRGSGHNNQSDLPDGSRQFSRSQLPRRVFLDLEPEQGRITSLHLVQQNVLNHIVPAGSVKHTVLLFKFPMKLEGRSPLDIPFSRTRGAKMWEKPSPG